MKETTKKIYEELFERYPSLSGIKESVLKAFESLQDLTPRTTPNIESNQDRNRHRVKPF